jgi:hypothetical protein
MFGLSPKEQLKGLKDLPQSSVGAPCPLVFATEQGVHVTYYLNDVDPSWDGKTVRVVSPESNTEPSIIVTFHRVTAHYFGMPNDEAMHGHPLSKLGLQAYSYFEVLNSSWRDELEQMNRVHPSHKKEHYSDVRHFIFTFHDTTLEVLARSYSFEITNLSLIQNIERVMMSAQ